jgi:hypothetical protein
MFTVPDDDCIVPDDDVNLRRKNRIFDLRIRYKSIDFMHLEIIESETRSEFRTIRRHTRQRCLPVPDHDVYIFENLSNKSRFCEKLKKLRFTNVPDDDVYSYPTTIIRL